MINDAFFPAKRRPIEQIIFGSLGVLSCFYAVYDLPRTHWESAYMTAAFILLFVIGVYVAGNGIRILVLSHIPIVEFRGDGVLLRKPSSARRYFINDSSTLDILIKKVRGRGGYTKFLRVQSSVYGIFWYSENLVLPHYNVLYERFLEWKRDQ